MKIKVGDIIVVKGYHPRHNEKLAEVLNVDGGYILVKPLLHPDEIVDLLRCECGSSRDIPMSTKVAARRDGEIMQTIKDGSWSVP